MHSSRARYPPVWYPAMHHRPLIWSWSTLQPRCAAGTAKGPMPAMTSNTTSVGLKVCTRRRCSCSSREFQYTWHQKAYPLSWPGGTGCNMVCTADLSSELEHPP
jgi:hypothetical protein